MITTEMFQKALKTAHEPCREDCVHADAFQESEKVIEEEIAKCVGYALTTGVSPALMLLSAGIHIGYRLHQLEIEPTPKEKVN